MKIKDYNDAIEFFRTNDFRAADGAWSEFYQSEVQEPRIMDLADGGRIGFPFGGSATAKKQAAEKSKKLKDFVAKYKLDNDGKLPRLTDIQKELKTSDTTTKKYLTEGEDFRITETVPGGKKYVKLSEAEKKEAYRKRDLKIRPATQEKEESLKKIFDTIFDTEDWGGIKSEFPGVGKGEGDIDKYHPTRKGKTGGKIPNQWYSQHVA